ncbi:MAG: putative PIN and TRAM-domain containing protein YacL [Chlamydiia bacterium]|nr:putative PIN and TRAM-domain containing protein YacL [Chlamydiia bacterium]MCH9618095.1 putative PIN and TRAM-domain containing protein YacL [Chlamydiia bacterium]MCH9623975.1 putative PIN and TRAM-domain containing protein YacL [Chlamydiia bacterium]
MDLPIKLTRIITSAIISLFTLLSFLFIKPLFGGSTSLNLLAGILCGALLCFLLATLDKAVRKVHLRVLATLILGLFVGIFLGKALGGIFDTIIFSSAFGNSIPSYLITFPKALIYLISIHLGMVATFACAEELHISVPFVRFNKASNNEKNIIIDDSILSDPRAIDFLSTGILNSRVILPTFILRDLQAKLDSCEEHTGVGIRKAIAVLEKLKSIKNLNLKENETDFSDLTDVKKKVHRLAKITKSRILTAEGSKLHIDGDEVEYLDLTSIANSLKNIMMAGESIEIKVQRYGKEPNQGVGYLEDGTMVVINNGGSFIGEIIETQVISVKQTSAGRIIFTNAMVEEVEDIEYAYDAQPNYEHSRD